MAASSIPNLFPGEILDHVAEFPCLYRYTSGSGDKPLAVLIPGGLHTARIFYGGHSGHRPQNFLCHWLNKLGFGVLAISYPIESTPALIPTTAPRMRVNDWGRQAAEVVQKVVRREGLMAHVVLVGWSMGGRCVVPFCRSAKEMNLEVRLFVSLSATPALPGARPAPKGVQVSRANYATIDGLEESFFRQLKEQEQLNDSQVIIPLDIYRSEYCGKTPIGLLGWGFRCDGEEGFVEDHWGHVQDAAAHEYVSLPLIACCYPTSQSDARHALTDKATWGYMLTQRLTTLSTRALLQDIPHACWKEIIELVHSAPGKLAAEIEGNHFFFLGEKGAKMTAGAILEHLKTSTDIERDLQQLLL